MVIFVKTLPLSCHWTILSIIMYNLINESLPLKRVEALNTPPSQKYYIKHFER
jgi:hypothetical protein